MTPQQQATLGRNAQAVIENPAFIKALELLHKGIARKRVAALLRDKEEIFLLVLMERVAVEFEQSFISFIQSGEYEQKKIDTDHLKEEGKAHAVWRKFM